MTPSIHPTPAGPAPVGPTRGPLGGSGQTKADGSGMAEVPRELTVDMEQLGKCPAALNKAGRHFDCDWQGHVPHDGWQHSNSEAQALWTDDRYQFPAASLGEPIAPVAAVPGDEPPWWSDYHLLAEKVAAYEPALLRLGGPDALVDALLAAPDPPSGVQQ